MKVFYAPDTSDHPNWGCRFMGRWFRRELALRAAAPTWTLGSRWFFRLPEGMVAPRTWSDVQRIGEDVRHGRLQLGPIAEALAACELVVMNGENFIRPGALKGRMLLVFAYLASQVFGKRCLLANVSLDLADPDLAGIAMRVLPALQEVQVREQTSFATYSAQIPGRPPRFGSDPGWTAQPRPLAEWGRLASRDGHLSAWPDVVEGFDPFEDYVTLGGSSAFGNDQTAVRNAVPAFSELARRLQALRRQVVLVAACEVDAVLMRQVAARTRLPLLGLNLPVEQAIDVLGQARLHVGGRWHPGIFATTGGTPLVAFEANNHKMRTLMHDLQPQAPVFDARRLAAHMDDVVAQAASQLAAGESLRATLRAKAAGFAARAQAALASVGG